MIAKELNQITRADLQRLVDDEVPESRTLEYKRDLYTLGDKESKREFLADVSAFANTEGGDLIIGIEEAKGIPINLCGIVGLSFELVRTQMLDLVRGGLEPKLPILHIQPVDIGGGSTALLLRIPKSWAAPHRVTLGGHAHFYARRATGKFPLDVPELRNAFLLGQSVAARIRDFRADRVLKVATGDTPVPMQAGGKVVFHIVPLAAVMGDSLPRLNGTTEVNLYDFVPPGSSNLGGRVNLDGFLTYNGTPEVVAAYTQVFRTGIVEVAMHVSSNEGGVDWVWPGFYEADLIYSADRYLSKLAAYGAQGPFYLFLSFCGVKNYCLRTTSYVPGRRPNADRDVMMLSEAVIEDTATNPNAAMRQLYGHAWNAFGFERALSFDVHGKFVGVR